MTGRRGCLAAWRSQSEPLITAHPASAWSPSSARCSTEGTLRQVLQVKRPSRCNSFHGSNAATGAEFPAKKSHDRSNRHSPECPELSAAPPNNQVTPSTAQIQPRVQGYQPANSATTQNAGAQQRAQSNQQQRQQTPNQPAGSSTVPSLQQEAQNRQRGARETQRFQQSQSNRPGRRN
jgi:hypothetical protein